MSSPWANKIRIYINPMANPDGYEYSRTTDRMWRGNMYAHARCGLSRARPLALMCSNRDLPPCTGGRSGTAWALT
jgi:hypothetical protein